MKSIIYIFFLLGLFVNINLYSQNQLGSNFEGTTNEYLYLGGNFSDFSTPNYFLPWHSVSLSESGNRIAIQSYSVSDSSCVVSIFEWNGFVWNKLGYDVIGYHASKITNDGSRIGVWAEEKFHIYEYNGNLWNELGSGIKADLPYKSWALSPNGEWMVYIISGGIWNYLYAYQWNGSEWIPMGMPIEGPINQDFGSYISLASDEKRFSIATQTVKGIASPAYVVTYEWDGVEWSQIGSPLMEDSDGLYFADIIDLTPNGNHLAIKSGRDFEGGFVYVYDWDGYDWVLRGTKIVSQDDDSIVMALSPDGQTVVFSHPYYDLSYNEGKVSTFKWNDNSWNRSSVSLTGEIENAQLGVELAINKDGSRIAITSPNYNENNLEYLGRVQVFEDFITSVKESNKFEKINIYPNPFSDYLTLDILGNEGEKINIEIYDFLGEKVYSQIKTNNGKNNIPTNKLQPGIFVIRLKVGNKNTQVKMIKL